MTNNKLGALWRAKDKVSGTIKTDRLGRPYYTGVMDINGQKVSIIMFENKKTKDSQPDFNIIVAKKPQTEETAQPVQKELVKPAQAQNQTEEEIRLEDIPF